MNPSLTVLVNEMVRYMAIIHTFSRWHSVNKRASSSHSSVSFSRLMLVKHRKTKRYTNINIAHPLRKNGLTIWWKQVMLKLRDIFSCMVNSGVVCRMGAHLHPQSPMFPWCTLILTPNPKRGLGTKGPGDIGMTPAGQYGHWGNAKGDRQDIKTMMWLYFKTEMWAKGIKQAQTTTTNWIACPWTSAICPIMLVACVHECLNIENLALYAHS